MTERVASHYQRLGVAPSASTAEIRVAYRALAARLHPDHSTGSTTAEQALAERRMREINESWRVLQDPTRRRAYDDSRLAGSPRRAAPLRADTVMAVDVDGTDDDLVDVLPPMTALTAGFFRHGPWVVLAVVLGLIFVVSAYAGGHEEQQVEREPTTQVGDCIDVAAGPKAIVVPCAGPYEYKIVASVSRPADCPSGTEGRRYASDGQFDCLSPKP